MCIKRGTFPWKGADDKTYVWVEEQDASTDSPRSSTDGSYESSTDPSADLLIDELRDHIDFLESQLDQEQRAHGELRRLLAGALERITALEEPQEPQRVSETASEGVGKGDVAPRSHRNTYSGARGGGRSSGWSKLEAQRSKGFWRRLFGG